MDWILETEERLKSYHKMYIKNQECEEFEEMVEVLNEMNGRGNDLHGTILSALYIQRKSILQIAKDTGSTVGQIKELKDQALKRLSIRLFGIEALRTL